MYETYGRAGGNPTALREAWLVASHVQPLTPRAQSLDKPVQRRQLAARLTRQQYERGADVIAIFEGAARDDPAMATILQGWQRERTAALRRLVEALESHLVPGLDVPDALATLVALTVSEVYRELVLAVGWSPDRYESWLAATLAHQLLAAPPPGLPLPAG